MFLPQAVVTGRASGFDCLVSQNDWIGAARNSSESARGLLRALRNLASHEPRDTPVGPMAVCYLLMLCFARLVMVFS